MDRRAYPSDIDDDAYTFLLPYLALTPEDAPQRKYPLWCVFWRQGQVRQQKGIGVVIDVTRVRAAIHLTILPSSDSRHHIWIACQPASNGGLNRVQAEGEGVLGIISICSD